jgi:hypothetical protein
MADLVYRGNLKTSSFPFLSELFGRSIIVKGQDQNYVGGLASKESLDSSVGVPQLYYCHNVVPIDNGYKSVGYIEYTSAAYPSTAGFSQSNVIRDGAGNSAQLSIDAVGNVYVMEKGTSAWTIPAGGPVAAAVAGKRITVSLVSGTTYIYFENVGCYTYDWGTGAFSAVTLAGLTAVDILGVAGNAGYLLAYSTDAIAWSSTIDPTDFTPSLTTGAGGGNVEGARGKIVTVEEVYGGFIVFCEENAVAGSFSGNSRYPYNFAAITGAGGLTNAFHTAQDAGSGSVYAYTTSGLQLLNLKNATPVFPECTDFLSGSLLEDYDELTNELILQDASGQELIKRLTLIADRYLIISYGITQLTHAIWYDVGYKQFGRLRINHTDCFEFVAYGAGTVEIPKRSVAFLGAGGSINILNTDIVAAGSNGVMLLGKFQYVRTRLLTMQQVEFENVNPGDTFNLYLLPSLNGKVLLPAVTGTQLGNSGKVRRYGFRTTALNHTIAAVGAFTAVSFVLTMTVQGAR